jgi:hypothetical protein
MNSTDAIRERLAELIKEGNSLRYGEERSGRCIDSDQYHKCLAWLTAAVHIVRVLFPSEDSVYKTHIEKLKDVDHEWRINSAVGEGAAVLANLAADLERGLLTTVINQTRAEDFDSFLDHARWYLSEGKKNEAGVISGVVFEDTIRRLARNLNLTEAGERLDSVISTLASMGTITGAMAKRARAAAHVRTKATHAQWTEFESGDVQAAIATTDELILLHLS